MSLGALLRASLRSLSSLQRVALGGFLLAVGIGAGACDSKSIGDETCSPGDTKDVDCNTCVCEDGAWSCTELACEYDPCAEKACGESCSICEPDDADCVESADAKACDVNAQCVNQASELMCEGEAYEPCADKSCGDTCTICAPDDADCVETQVIKACDLEGACVAEVPDLCEEPGETYDPCADKSCGDTCKLCAPDDDDCVETQEVKACTDDGECLSEGTFECQ